MLTIPVIATAIDSQTKYREISFVADRSGSMQHKMARLRSAMMFFIKGIPEGVRFNIWSFGSNFSFLWRQAKPLDSSSMQEALEHVQNDFLADLGGIEI